jgi:serine protease Do
MLSYWEKGKTKVQGRNGGRNMNFKNLFRSKKKLIVKAAVVLALLGLLLATVITVTGASGSTVSNKTAHPTATAIEEDRSRDASLRDVSIRDVNILQDLQLAYRQVAQKVLPVVVQIDIVDVVTQTVPQYQSPFDFFFGPQDEEKSPREREFRRYGLGSGVIVKRAGTKVYVLTNNHVVGEADEISVKLYDERQYTASLVGKDPNKDLALVVFETPDEVPVAEFGDSDEVQVGDIVVAVGNPMGFQSSVTSGIVSAVGRKSIPGSGVALFTDYIQTDAAINQGNSGGPLVDIYGKVIGINTWISSPSGGSVGLGFTIPINNAKKAIEDFITKGKVEYGWLGVSIIDLPAEVKKDLGVEGADGSFVYNVYKKSPADKAGILPGDYVTGVNGEPVSDSTHFLFLVAGLAPKRAYDFELMRDGESMSLSVRIEERMAEDKLAQQRQNLWPGIFVVRITEDIEKQLDLPKRLGDLVVAQVQPDTPAAVSGIRPGDIVMEVNGKKVTNLKDFYGALNSPGDKTVMFRLYRQGQEITVGLER